MKQVHVWILVIGSVIASISLAASPSVRWYRHRQWLAWTASTDASLRVKAFDGIARHCLEDGRDEILRALATDQDRYVLASAGYAAARLRISESVELLRRRIEEPPDDYTRAELMCCLVRAADEEQLPKDWLLGCLDSEEPWRRAGAAAALLESGEPRGGAVLIDLIGNTSPDTATFAYHRLRSTAEPLAITLGYQTEWPETAEAFVKTGGPARLATWWCDHVDARTVADVWHRLRQGDKRWREMDRLTSGRRHVTRWMGLGT